MQLILFRDSFTYVNLNETGNSCDVPRLDVLNTANLCPAVSVVGLFYLLTYCDVYVCLVWNSGPF